jgi:hypothetical protein
MYQVDPELRLDHLSRQLHPSHFVRQFLVDLSRNQISVSFNKYSFGVLLYTWCTGWSS